MRAPPAYYHRLSMLKVTAVAPESLGAELGLQVGTELLRDQRPGSGGFSRLGVPDGR